MIYRFEVENIKCGGCANSIRKKLNSSETIHEVEIDIERGVIQVDAPAGLDTESVSKTLANMGYPAPGTGTGLQRAKSYVSCMVGRLS